MEEMEIICLTETNLQNDVASAELFSEIHDVCRCNRDLGSNDVTKDTGVLLAAKSCLNLVQLDLYSLQQSLPTIEIVGGKNTSGKTVAQEDPIITEGGKSENNSRKTTEKKWKFCRKRKNETDSSNDRPKQDMASSSSDSEQSDEYSDTDDEPETFLDIEQGKCASYDVNIQGTEHNDEELRIKDYIFVTPNTQQSKNKEYGAQILSIEHDHAFSLFSKDII
ncbi:hypothetical protein JTB14_025017 [Gonioctena quinquepunctata]|nr:hypothetical protein JTB14_025017 [Gonioctena quinquepunctata]